MTKSRKKELTEQLKFTILYMLDRYPSSEYWNTQFKLYKQLVRKLK